MKPDDSKLEALCAQYLRYSPFNIDWAAMSEGYRNVQMSHMRAALKVAYGDGEPSARNKLIIDAYRAMDAVDAIRAWCDGQKYANETITVSRLRDMLPKVPS